MSYISLCLKRARAPGNADVMGILESSSYNIQYLRVTSVLPYESSYGSMHHLHIIVTLELGSYSISSHHLLDAIRLSDISMGSNSLKVFTPSLAGPPSTKTGFRR